DRDRHPGRSWTRAGRRGLRRGDAGRARGARVLDRRAAAGGDRPRPAATAESCTGGMVAAALTAIAGSSEAFTGGVVAYSNALKRDMLSVSEAVLDEHGAVSAEVAAAMASGARAQLGADAAVAVTGIAGPGGGTEQKPVGLVHL